MPLAEGIPEDFHQQFAAWVRLEPRCRSNDFARSLQARTADPLWMLARQWQTGEFQGEDAGSPIEAHLKHSTQSLDRVRLGENGSTFDLPNAPLEAIVEQERFELHWRTRVQIGQQFERFAHAVLKSKAQELIHALRKRYRLDPPTGDEWVKTDRATRRFLEFMAGRVIDGQKLLCAIEGGRLVVSDGELEQVLNKFNEWRTKLHLQPSTNRSEAWRNQQLDYRFELNPPEDSATDKTHLVAPEYRNGALDWHTFNMASEIRGKWTPGDPIKTHPTRITVAGASPRWWAFEDAATDFGKLDVAKPDLAKLMLMEFVLIYGDDWFSIPLPVTMPNLVRIDELKVRNVFGDETIVQPARLMVRKAIADKGGDPNDPLLRWEMFTLSPAAAPDAPTLADVLFIPPVAGFREESPPMEEVRFLRDEGANMAWAVEHIIQNGLGRPIHGFDAQNERIERRREADIARLEAELKQIERKLEAGGMTNDERKTLQAEAESKRKELNNLRNGIRPVSTGTPRYRLATTVPENWFPFTPANAQAFSRSIRLRRAQMLRNADDEDPRSIPAMSRLLDLAEDPLLELEEVTVPRSGLCVQLTGQRVRWVDGKTYVWLGRKVLTGRGEGSSGLRFDVVK